MLIPECQLYVVISKDRTVLYYVQSTLSREQFYKLVMTCIGFQGNSALSIFSQRKGRVVC